MTIGFVEKLNTTLLFPVLPCTALCFGRSGLPYCSPAIVALVALVSLGKGGMGRRGGRSPVVMTTVVSVSILRNCASKSFSILCCSPFSMARATPPALSHEAFLWQMY